MACSDRARCVEGLCGALRSDIALRRNNNLITGPICKTKVPSATIDQEDRGQVSVDTASVAAFEMIANSIKHAKSAEEVLDIFDVRRLNLRQQNMSEMD